MKQVISTLLILLSIGSADVYAQTPACCVKAAGSGLMALAQTEEFAKAHEAPVPFAYEEKRGSEISYQTLDGKPGKAYYVSAPEATNRALIIFHEWWGLNYYIRREADRWQDSLGPIDVYAIDLFDGAVATTAEEAGKLSGSLDKRRADVLIKGLLAKVGRDYQVSTLGWCMGGSYAFRAAILAENQARGCVMYYGFPEKDAKNISPLQTDVLYIHGTLDKFITVADVAQFEQAVKQTGRKITVITTEADHAFANPSNPHFDAVRALEMEQHALKFLRNLQQL